MLGSMTVQDLIGLCAADCHAPEWPLLWSVIDRATQGLVRRLLFSHHLDKGRGDDILQDLFLYLQKDAFRRLKIFHGISEAQFKTFAYTIGRRFTLHWIQKDYQSKHDEAQALADRPKADRDGPTERQITARRDEIRALMSNAERARFDLVSDCNSLPETRKIEASFARLPSPRTRRHWRRDLCKKYGSRV